MDSWPPSSHKFHRPLRETEMLQGKDLFTSPYNLTRATLFEFVRSGTLVPYRKSSSLYPDPTEPTGCERIFPRHEQGQIYGRLSWARYQRKWLHDWLATPKHMRPTDLLSVPLSDEKYGADLRELNSEIPKLEGELAPSKVWQDEFSPRVQEEIFTALEQAWYSDSDCQKALNALERKGNMLRDNILLEPEQIELLCKLIEAERSAPKGQRGKFLCAEGQGEHEDLFIYTAGEGIEVEGNLTDAEILAEKGLLGSRQNADAYFLFHIKPDALQYYRELKRSPQPAENVESEIRNYLSSTELQKFYNAAYRKWAQAESLLWESDSEKQFTTMGHLCREALQEFADTLVNIHKPAGADPDKSKTVSRIRAVLQKSDRLGNSEKAFLDQLLGYWGTVSDLVQRQEHGGIKEGEPLRWEDGRRVVFQTMIVMYEIHRSLTK